jgi:hypothetical protein
MPVSCGLVIKRFPREFLRVPTSGVGKQKKLVPLRADTTWSSACNRCKSEINVVTQMGSPTLVEKTELI